MIEGLLSFAVEIRASDIYIIKDIVPCFRINGEVYRIFKTPKNKRLLSIYPDLNKPMSAEIIKAMAKKILPEGKKLKGNNNLCFTYQTKKNQRFRVLVYQQRNSFALAIRVLYPQIPTVEELFVDFPEIINNLNYLTKLNKGLVLITGPVSSGKTTTLATIINEINKDYSRHIMTIEDPIEYKHNHKKSIISQREVNTDVKNFEEGILCAMKSSVDIIAVDEIQDINTIKNIIKAANLGHLVFATLYSNRIIEAIERFYFLLNDDLYRQSFVFSLQGVISQHLLCKKDGKQVAIAEGMIVTREIRECLRKGNLNKVHSIAQDKQKNVFPIERSVSRLIKQGVVSKREVVNKIFA